MDWLVPLVMGKSRLVNRGVTAANTTSPAGSPDMLSSPIPGAQTLSIASSNRPLVLQSGAIELDFRSHTSHGQTEQDLVRSASPLSSSITASLALQPGKTSPSSGKESSCSPDLPVSEVPPFMQSKFISQQICKADFTELVEPFPSMDNNEWLAAHAIALFENLTTIFDAIQDLCTCNSLFPTAQHGQCAMAWITQLDLTTLSGDEDRTKKSKSCTASVLTQSSQCARQIIDDALSFCHEMIQSSHLFPVRSGDNFPINLPSNVTMVCKHLLLCIIHLYLSHFHHLEQFELIPHMNTLAKHYFAFTSRFSLVDEKHFEPLSGFHRALFSTNTSATDVH